MRFNVSIQRSPRKRTGTAVLHAVRVANRTVFPTTGRRMWRASEAGRFGPCDVHRLRECLPVVALFGVAENRTPQLNSCTLVQHTAELTSNLCTGCTQASCSATFMAFRAIVRSTSRVGAWAMVLIRTFSRSSLLILMIVAALLAAAVPSRATTGSSRSRPGVQVAGTSPAASAANRDEDDIVQGLGQSAACVTTCRYRRPGVRWALPGCLRPIGPGVAMPPAMPFWRPLIAAAYGGFKRSDGRGQSCASGSCFFLECVRSETRPVRTGCG